MVSGMRLQVIRHRVEPVARTTTITSTPQRNDAMCQQRPSGPKNHLMISGFPLDQDPLEA
jgi:hypothetical protein